MSLEDERRAIEGRFSANYSATPIQYENVPLNEQVTDAWVALFIRHGDSEQVSIGDNPWFRDVSVIMLQMFNPKNKGTARLKQLADLIVPIWRRAEFSLDDSGLIRCRAPSVVEVGVQGDWFQANVEVPYIRDEQV